MSVEIAQLFGDNIGLDRVVSPESGIGATDDEKISPALGLERRP
jgi:hypothetical protein